MTANIRRVLIVDDDPAMQIVLGGIVESAGWRAELAQNAAEARRALSTPDAAAVVLMDWMLPGMSGIELCRELRLTSEGRPYIILVTSRSHPEDVATGLDAGADDYLVKPVNPKEVRARIGAGFRTIEMQEELARRVADLEAALKRVTQLERLLPVCMYCRRIRGDQNWQSVEDYLWERADVKVSHGCCPDCLKTLHDPHETP